MRFTDASAKLSCAVIHLANSILKSALACCGNTLPSRKRGSTSFFVRGFVAFTKLTDVFAPSP